jgi:hypothetical protein
MVPNTRTALTTIHAAPSQNTSPLSTIPRTIKFSGYEWAVKTSVTPVGPGPNFFSDSGNNVRVDDQGSLHMKITRKGDHWECAEIVSQKNFGYGEYVFTLATDPELLDKEVVLGLFTWDDHPDYHYREIDLEFSRWEDPLNMNAQYVVQPYYSDENIHRFNVKAGGNVTTHSFNWQPGRIAFLSYSGPYAVSPGPQSILQSWDYTGNDIPPPGNENARINLWLVHGNPPADGKEREFIIRQFAFIPEAAFLTGTR